MSKLTKTALKRKKAVSDEVLIPADNEQARKLADAHSEREAARHAVELAIMSGNAKSESDAKIRLEQAEITLATVKDEVRSKGLSFVLEGVGRERWDQLIVDNPPTEEQIKQAEADKLDPPTMNPETFWPALLAECVRDSDLTAEDWRAQVFESKEWGPQELEELRNRARLVNQTSRLAELGN